MNFSHYLPDTYKRILRLKRVIRNRPVAILLPGFSLAGLQKHIGDLKKIDICYASVNNYAPLEDSILSKIGKHFTILMCSANPDQMIEPICSFLDRQEENVFISERLMFRAEGGHNLVKLYNKYDDKLLFFTSILDLNDKPNTEYPLHFLAQNSLSILLAFVIIGGASEVILFGADGGKISADGLYFNNLSDSSKPHPDGFMPSDSLLRDTGWFNQVTPLMLERLGKLYGKEPDILNCSLHSHLNVFAKISYDDAIKHLRR